MNKFIHKTANFFYTLFNHRKIIQELEEEVDKDFELKVKEFRQTVEETEVKVESPFLAIFVDHMIQIYEKNGGENYLSMTTCRGTEHYVFTIQRMAGKSPAEKASDLEEAVVHLNGEVYSLKEKLRSIAKEVDNTDEIPSKDIKNEKFSLSQVQSQNQALTNIWDIVLPYSNPDF